MQNRVKYCLLSFRAGLSEGAKQHMHQIASKQGLVENQAKVSVMQSLLNVYGCGCMYVVYCW